MPDQVPAAPAQSAPQTPVSNDDAINQFANGFLESLDRDTDPNQQDQIPADEQQPTDEPTETEEPQGAEPPPQEIPLEDVEVDGETFKVPKKVRDSMLMHADYTRKTQETAAIRKNLEAMTQSAQQITARAQQLAPMNAQLYAMQSQAQHLRAQLTQDLRVNDPITYNTVQGELGLLIQDISGFSGQLQQAQQEQDQELNALRAQQLQIELPPILKAIPDLGKKEVQAALTQYAVDNGLPDEAIAYMRFSAPAVKILYQSQQYEKLVADQAKARKSITERTNGLPPVKPGRATNVSQDKEQLASWKKGGGKMTDANFDKILSGRLKR